MRTVVESRSGNNLNGQQRSMSKPKSGLIASVRSTVKITNSLDTALKAQTTTIETNPCSHDLVRLTAPQDCILYEKSNIKSDAIAQVRRGNILMVDREPVGHWAFCKLKDQQGFVLRKQIRNKSPTLTKQQKQEPAIKSAKEIIVQPNKMTEASIAETDDELLKRLRQQSMMDKLKNHLVTTVKMNQDRNFA